MLSLMSLAPFIALIGVLGFAAASFFFALAETALFSLGQWRARRLTEHWRSAFAGWWCSSAPGWAGAGRA